MTTACIRRVPADFHQVRRAIDAALDDFLHGKEVSPYGVPLAVPLQVLRDFLAGGGKRLRPLYCYCGWLAADGDPEDPAVMRLAAGVELFHTFALIHDDIIDASDIRRGHPTAQRSFDRAQPRPRTPRFGENTAVLLGDLCAVWADELFSEMPAAARPVLDSMRTELVLGQYLDLCATGDGTGSVEAAHTVNTYKSGSYTVQRPLHIGAASAGADRTILDACSAYGLPLGEAFQMCDDLEDVVEHPEDAGYVGNDLKEGKATVVTALAVERATPAQRSRLAGLLGNPDLDSAGAAEARAVIAATGAVRTTIEMIKQRRARALAVLDTAPFPPHVRDMLTQLALRAVRWPE